MLGGDMRACRYVTGITPRTTGHRAAHPTGEVRSSEEFGLFCDRIRYGWSFAYQRDTFQRIDAHPGYFVHFILSPSSGGIVDLRCAVAVISRRIGQTTTQTLTSKSE